MKNRKKLFQAKRILAILLAAAMGVSSLPPTTVNAAEVTPVVTEDAADTSIPETDDVTADTTDQTDKPSDDVSNNDPEPFAENPALVTASEGDVPALKTEIKVDLTDDETTAVYNGQNAFSGPEFQIALYSGIHVYVDGVENTDALSELKFSLKQVQDEGEVVLEGNPVNAGTYYLDITLEAKEGSYSAATQRVTLTITKAPLTVKATAASVKSGTKAGDVTLSNISASYKQTGKTFTYTPDNSSTEEVDESEASELSYTVKIKDAITGEVLDSDVPLVKGSDYVAELTLAFTDKVSALDQGNYELLPASLDITIGELVSTAMKLQFTDTWSGGYKKTYDNNAVSLVKDTDYTVKVVRTDNGEEIPNPELKAYWVDEDDILLDAAPTNAGTYYYIVSYEPNDNIYLGCKNKLEVVINPAELTIKPTVKQDAIFYPGTPVSEVLEQTGYQVFDANKNDITDDIDKNNFWGTVNEDGVSYPLVPLFTIQEIIMPENETSGSVSYRKLDYDDLLEKGKSYCVCLSGNKGFYNLQGELINNGISINSNLGNGNYTVDTSNAKLLENAVAINLAEDFNASIDVSAILKNAAGNSYDNPITKTYDTETLYEKTADYKKAVVKASVSGEEKTLAKDADSTLQYTWCRQTGVTDGNPAWAKIESLPKNAGNYKLVISYTDSKNTYYAKPAEVFYKIDKQKVRIIPSEEEYTAWAGETISSFLNRTKPECEIVTIQKDDTDGEKLNLKKEEYSISLQVEKNAEDTWSALQNSDSFEMEGTYRLTGKLRADNYYTEETVIASEIAINQMGSIELQVTIDDTKLTPTNKTYDGEEFDISKALENGLITIATKEAEPKPVDASDLGLVYTWRNSEDTIVEAPVNAGEYKYFVSFPGNETYKAFDEVKAATITISKRPLIVEPVVKENIVAGPVMPEYLGDLSEEDAMNLTVNDILGLYVNYPQTKFNGVVEKDKDAFTYQKFYDEYNSCYHEGWPAFSYSREDQGIFLSGVVFVVFDKKGNPILPFSSINTLKGETEYDIQIMNGFTSNSLAEPYKQNYIILPKKKSFTTVRGNSSVTASVAVNDAIEDMKHTITTREAISYSYDVRNNDTDETLNGNFVSISIRIPLEYSSLPNTALYENSIKKAGGFNIVCAEDRITAMFDVSAKNKKEFDIRWEVGYTEHFVLDCTDAMLLTDLRNAVAPKSLAFNSPSTKMVVGETQQLDVKLTKVQESDTIRLIYSVDNKEFLHVEENGLVVALKKGSATVTVSPAKLVDGKLVAIEGAKTAKVKITVNDVSAPKINKVTAVDTKILLEYTKAKNGSRHEVYVLEGKKTANDFEAAISSMKNNKWQGIFAIAPEYYGDGTDTLYNLKANTAYTVYVRNVTVESTFEDGCKLTQSHAGTVKSFTTTKQMADEIRVSFAEENAGYNENENYSYVTIPLSKGTTSVSVDGLFYDDTGKAFWEAFPLSKALQNNYANLKFVYNIYVVKESYEGSKGCLDRFFDSSDGKYKFVYTTNQASIDKKGKIKVKSAGEYIIYVTGEKEYHRAYAKLLVSASADSITGKNVKLKVGQSMSLYDMIVYKDGKKAISGSFEKEIVVDDALLKAFEENDCFKLSGTTVTATKTGTISFSVKDAYIDGKTATVTISATAMDDVKNLKTQMVTDQFFDLEFTHSGYADGFHIAVRNARGTTIKEIYVPIKDLYDEATGKYSYRIEGLTAKSKYTVSISAYFGAVESKAVKKSVTTTQPPISYVSLGSITYGGVDISLPNTDTTINRANLVSGNTYSLLVSGDLVNYRAVYAETDSLTWTSSNKKVATVKATKGTVFATLKTLKAGTTTIEVKSKITKAVIARYKVEIHAVGNAYDYYGDNEAPNQSSNALTLTLNSGLRVTTNEDEYAWLTFTAPSSGSYRFYSVGDDDPKAWFFRDRSIGNDATRSELNNASRENGYGYNDDAADETCNFSKTISLQAGQTVFIAVGYYDLSEALTNTTVYVTAD